MPILLCFLCLLFRIFVGGTKKIESKYFYFKLNKLSLEDDEINSISY